MRNGEFHVESVVIFFILSCELCYVKTEKQVEQTKSDT